MPTPFIFGFAPGTHDLYGYEAFGAAPFAGESIMKAIGRSLGEAILHTVDGLRDLTGLFIQLYFCDYGGGDIIRASSTGDRVKADNPPAVLEEDFAGWNTISRLVPPSV